MANKKTTKKQGAKEKVILTLGHTEYLMQPFYSKLMEKDFPNQIVLSRVMRFCEILKSELKLYLPRKQKIAEKHAKKKNNKLVVDDNGNLSIPNMVEYTKELVKLQEEKIETNLEKIDAILDEDLPSLSGADYSFLTFFVDMKEGKKEE